MPPQGYQASVGCLVRVGRVASVLVLAGRMAPMLVLGRQVGDGLDVGERRAKEFL